MGFFGGNFDGSSCGSKREGWRVYLTLGFERSCRVKRPAHLRLRIESVYVFSTAAVNLDVYFREYHPTKAHIS